MSHVSLRIPSAKELVIESLGEATHPSPVRRDGAFIDEASRVSLLTDTRQLEQLGREIPSLERGGPREKLFFDPATTVCGIVTCGGLCPGLNDVIRSLTLNLRVVYGVRQVLGFRYGYKGLTTQGPDPIELTAERVQPLRGTAGTFLGSSRGPQDPAEMVDALQRWGVQILFVLGGDGTLRGGSALAAEIRLRGLAIGVVGIPKTIDNDIAWTSMSFGFHTAVEEARRVILAASAEACSAENGIGLVKLMGRHSGFIAAHAACASSVANFCIVPEVDLDLDGFLARLRGRLQRSGTAVIVVAEGAGQELMAAQAETDASGNQKLNDIGLFLKERILADLSQRGLNPTLKYIDPSYTIRSAPPNTIDSEFCLLLGHFASHAGLAGKTDMTVGWWNQSMVHLPISIVTGQRKQLDPRGELWQSVLTMTGA